jgi:hypothetical protein
MNHAKLNIVRSAIVQGRSNRQVYSLPILGMNQPGEIVHAAGKLSAFDAMNLVNAVGPLDVVLRHIPIPNSDPPGIQRQFQTFFPVRDGFFRLPVLCYLAKDSTDPRTRSLSSRMGAELSSIGMCLPFRWTRVV